MEIARAVVACCALTVGCAAPGVFEKDKVHHAFIKDFSSTEPESCTRASLQLEHSDVELFFKRARIFDRKTLEENYPVAPCHIEGVLKYGDRNCTWEITAAYIGTVTCGEETTYFACDHCEDLFKRIAFPPSTPP